MIDRRVALQKGYLFNHSDNERIEVVSEIGRGANCIVYDANLYDKSGVKHSIRIKELYPVYLFAEREEDYSLIYKDSVLDKIEKTKDQFKETYKKAVNFKNKVGFINSTIDSSGIFEFNNTVYIIMTLNEGMDYERYKDESLKEVLKYIKSLAILIKKYHDKGFLHLDIKPENIFVIPETTEHIYLFDFDSVINVDQLENKRIMELSYSEGYSAPEQIRGQIRNIGYHTDIYAIGAVLFYKIFGRKPQQEDCRISSIYCFECMNFANEKYRPKLFKRLSYFFHKALAISIKSRWSDLNDVIEVLDELIVLSDVDAHYLVDNFVYNPACFVGRSDELVDIQEALSENQVVFISGIGGIGKTELAKRYAYEYRDYYETIAFAFFNGSIEHTVCQELVINNMSMDENVVLCQESEDSYFKRIVAVLKETTTEKDLIIIDNFDVDSDDRLEELLQCPCKFIFTTRKDFRDYNFRQINIGRMKKSEELKSLFCYYNNTLYDMEETSYIDKLIEYVEGHTMTVELISKYLRDSDILPRKLYELFLSKEGVTNTDETVVKQRKDRRMNAESVNRHLMILFDISNFDSKTNEIISSLSLFAGIKVRKDIFIGICNIDGCEDKIHKLILNGWVEYDEFYNKISLHQVIQDLIFKEYKPSTTSCPNVANGIILYLNQEYSGYIERNIRRRVFDTVCERITGTDILYANICLEYGKKNKVNEAIAICERIECCNSHHLLVKLLLKRIKYICDFDILWESVDDSNVEEYYENILGKVEEIFCYAIDICYKEKNLRDRCTLLVELCDEIDSFLADSGSDENVSTFMSLYFDTINKQDDIYRKIIEVYDYVTEVLLGVNMPVKEKIKLYGKVIKFYSDDEDIISDYRFKHFGDLDKAYGYQEVIRLLREGDTDGKHSKYLEKTLLEKLALSYTNKKNYDKAIDMYCKLYDRGIYSYNSKVKNIVDIYLKKGDVDSAISNIMDLIRKSSKLDFDMCLKLVELLVREKKIDKVKSYASILIYHQRRKSHLEDANLQETQYVLMAYYYLYCVEIDIEIKKRYWEKANRIFELSIFKSRSGGKWINEIIIYPYVLEYLKKEKMDNYSIIGMVNSCDRSNWYLKEKLEFISTLKQENIGDNPMELRVLLDLKAAELLNECPDDRLEEALNLCEDALNTIKIYGLDNEYINNKVNSIRSELIYKCSGSKYEDVDKIRKRCDYYLIAEVESENSDLNNCIKIWEEAADRYNNVGKDVEQLRCLYHLELIFFMNLNKYDFIRFYGDIDFLITKEFYTYKNMSNYNQASSLLRDWHKFTVQYYRYRKDIEFYELGFKDIANNFNGIEHYVEAYNEYIYSLYMLLYYKDEKCKWEEELTTNFVISLYKDIIKGLDLISEDIVDKIIELKDDIIKYMPDDLKDNEYIKTIIQIISSNYQNNEIEFKDK
ncbi:protein kinase domain-containing protein [Lachnoanaerobaculum sp. OBRC5-5]|uniref:protein kinase domain-containing protein n=1 Tax=Lachnoanaerobaculum sp. OBRC5-5 TaxID=936595 RepID=UPI0002824BD9|nr:NB-ARC domain-containing protein [Lachnoanaerobaculum sp. OBRC5-5]EJZ69590.1 hypothetical protein HMPREF1135_01887 [Lachnoanaerobaculum sp. OBRC5-5]